MLMSAIYFWFVFSPGYLMNSRAEFTHSRPTRSAPSSTTPTSLLQTQVCPNPDIFGLSLSGYLMTSRAEFEGQPDRRPGFQKRTLTYSFFERVSCSGYLNGESACAIFNNTNIFAPNPGEENMYQIENFQIVQCNRKPGPTDKFKRQNIFFQACQEQGIAFFPVAMETPCGFHRVASEEVKRI